MITHAQSGIGEPSSNFGPVCDIHFCTNIHKKKDMGQSYLTNQLGIKQQGRLGSLALGEK